MPDPSTSVTLRIDAFASIGRSPRTERPEQLFPLTVDGPGSDLGHTSERSFGATSYLVEVL